MYKYEVKDIYSVYNLAIIQNPTIYPSLQPGQKATSAVYTSLSHNNTDYRFDPSSGMVNSLSLEVAGLGGDTKYLRSIMDNVVYEPLWWKFVGSARLVLGAVGKVGASSVDMDEKFYLGGLGTIRGYSSRSISPYNMATYTYTTTDLLDTTRTETGVVRVNTGGSYELFGNAEIKFPLIPESGLKGVFFFDYGNTWDAGMTPPNLLTSYGFGIRWASPMGPLRLEYGIPINPRPGIDSSSGRFEFAIGSMF